jgi:D-glycerate 3-kinase
MLNISPRLEPLISAEISNKGLPSDFASTVSDYYLTLASEIALTAHQRITDLNSTLFVGVFGSQGSGKSTLADFLKLILEQQFNTSTVVMSLDDFYLTREQRQKLSTDIHPLLITRGVPGTHDIELLNNTIDQLKNFDSSVPVRVPVFEKANDDRAPLADWQNISTKPKVIILEGWCVGVGPQLESELQIPVNDLERSMDKDAHWRGFVNQKLAGSYATVFNQLDKLVALVAPSFDCVHQWRSLQESKLIDKLEQAGLSTAETMSDEQITFFIAHYQRITEHALASLPSYANWCLAMDENHRITGLSKSENVEKR